MSEKLKEIEKIYSKWVQKDSKKALLPDLSEAREFIQNGLHLLNK